MLVSIFIVLLIILCTCYYFRNAIYRSYTLPPGPTALPFIGNFHQFRPSLWQAAQNFKDKYGEIVHFKMGMMDVILLNSFQSIKDCLQTNGLLFSGRIQNETIAKSVQNCGIILTEGETWQFHRRLSLRLLRDLGFGRPQAEMVARNELEELFKIIDARIAYNESMETEKIFVDVISSVIASLVFGERCAYTDKEFEQYKVASYEMVRNRNFLDNLVVIIPKLMFLTKYFPRLLFLHNNTMFCLKYVDKKIDEHRKTCDIDNYEAESKDFCEAYLREQAKCKSNAFPDFQITRTLFEFFIAGTETTSTTLCWTMIYLSLNQHVQLRMQEELDKEIGRDRLPEMKDKINLHYINAVIDEVNRMSSLVPLGLAHRPMKDTTYNGYDFPSTFLIMPNLYAVHHDNNYWKDPEVFRPERFIDCESGKYQPDERLIPFGIGKRNCLGESLARMELFIFTAGLLQRYNIALAPGANIDELTLGSNGFNVRSPGAPHAIIFSQRRDN